MKRKCEHCGKLFTPKKYLKDALKNLDKDLPRPAISCAFMGGILEESYCDNKACQDHAQYEADMFDMARKEEF